MMKATKSAPELIAALAALCDAYAGNGHTLKQRAAWEMARAALARAMEESK